MKKIVICPFKRLQAALAGETGRVIAIISGSSQPETSRLPQIPYVFRQYDDIDMPVPGRSFSEEDAKCFAGFLRKEGPAAEVIYCCCDAGQSRSPAVAAAVCRFFEQEDMHIWKNPRYHPNMLVFDMLMAALGSPVSDEEKDWLLYENRRAFQKAIRGEG